MDNQNAKSIGDRSVGAIIGQFMKCGFTISIPLSDNQRYDLILDSGDGTLKKVQCKSGRLADPSIIHYKIHNSSGRYDGQTDYFAIYCRELDLVYLVPIEEATGFLRLLPPKNNRRKGVKWAKDYLLDSKAI